MHKKQTAFKQNNQVAKSTANATNKKRIWLFRLVAICIPIVFFILLEMLLRISGFGRELPLFIVNNTHPDYLLPNPEIVKRYFPNEDAAPNVSMEANFLLREKPHNGIRIFVQGGSTAAGFPYGLGASIAGLLDQRIKDSLPGQNVEVVNTAMSAVNSYSLLDFADEIIAKQPDAIVIYAGHNEFLGVLGVGSNYSAFGSNATNLMFLKIKNLRLFQAMQQFYIVLQQSSKESDINTQPQNSNRRTLMAQVAKHKDIVIDSPLFIQGITQFETNMSLLLHKYQQADIPVFISTIASNLKDQKPFVSSVADATHLKQLADLRSQAKNSEDISQELVSLSEELLNNSQSADLHFEIGHMFYVLQQYQKAKTHFVKAKDLDQLRFRAPEKVNTVIKHLSGQYGANLVPVEKALMARSHGGIVGNNLMLEHLHPNLQGYFTIANAFYEAIDKSHLFKQWQTITAAEAWKNRPVLPAEEYNAFAKILRLKSDYPFVDRPFTDPHQQLNLPHPSDWQQQIGYDLFSKKLDWLAMVEASRKGYLKLGDSHMLLKIDRLLADALPHSARANFNAGNSLQAKSQKELAKYYFTRALNAPDVTEAMKKRIQSFIN